MNDTQIRPATLEDVPAMYKIDVDGWHQNFIDPDRGITAEILETKYGKVYDDQNKLKAFGDQVMSDGQVSYVAETGGKVIGWINLENLYTPDLSWLNVYVDREWQSRGVGRLLMQAMIKDFGQVEMHLATPEKAGLQRFYEKFGFVAYPVEGRLEGDGNLFMIQMKRDPSTV